ncbi:hypothetical protein GQ42DRAFT_160124 [Ramicandelaber brevisporus]|nr:hypothetical protein GQ42DRAFT_160124 [Ramicandelaber brevisporus]
MMFKSTVLTIGIIASSLFAVTSAEPTRFSSCGSAADIGHPIRVTISPDPPAAGKDVTVSIDAQLDQPVNNGDISVKLMVGPFPFNSNLKLCDIAPLSGNSCPLSAGMHKLVIKHDIPALLQGRPVGFEFRGVADGGRPLFCYQGSTTIA